MKTPIGQSEKYETGIDTEVGVRLHQSIVSTQI